MAATQEIKQQNTTILEKIEIILNLLNHVFIGFISIYITYLCISVGLKTTSLHAWLCTIGYQLLMAEAILSLYSGNSWSIVLFHSRKGRTTAHWVLMILGCGLGIGGSLYYIYLRGGRIKSIHAITGLTSTVLLFVGLVTGLAAQYSQTLQKYFKPIFNKTIHNFLGLSGFVIGMVSLYYGYNTGFSKRLIPEDLISAIKAFTIITIILSVLGSVKSLYRNVVNMF